jgi:OPT family oligopeptide transporter
MKRTDRKRDDLAAIEAPGSWFLYGQVVALVALALLAHATFGMPYWQSFIAVLLSFALALVACRVTGETDTTPVGAMGKITQLTFGALSPGNMNVNLMAANITAGAATSSADLLTDLKSGYLLGANPRKQFIAQFAGIFVGTLVTVAAFRILVPDASVLGTDQFPAPAAQTWKGVAEAMANGLSAMHPVKVWSIVIGGLVGLILPILSRLFPKKQNWIPSAAGIGLAWVFQWFYGLLFFIGALIGYRWQKKNAKQCEEYLFPVASGVVAGGALMGVVLIFWENGAEILKQLF